MRLWGDSDDVAVGPARDAGVRSSSCWSPPLIDGRGDRRVSVCRRCGRRSSASTCARMCGAPWRGRPAVATTCGNWSIGTGRRLALDEELVTVTSATGETSFALSDTRRQGRGDAPRVAAGVLPTSPRSTPSSAGGSITIRPCSTWRSRPLWGALALFLGGLIGARSHSMPSTHARGARGTPRARRTTHRPPAIIDYVTGPPRSPASPPASAGRPSHPAHVPIPARLPASPTRAVTAGEATRPRGLPHAPLQLRGLDPFFK